MIRAATPADLTALAALEAELFGADAWDAASLAHELSTPGRRVTVLDDGAVAAYAVVMVAGDVADLLRIGVLPARQRTGLARLLLADAVHAAADAGARRMLLEVSADNEAAQALYLDFGFAEIDRRRRYYRDGSDAVVLARDL